MNCRTKIALTTILACLPLAAGAQSLPAGMAVGLAADWFRTNLMNCTNAAEVIAVLGLTNGLAGPQGPAGTNGLNGTNGVNGTNGTNGLNGAAANIEAGYTLAPAAVSTDGLTNFYWLDFGRTNSSGQAILYASLAATNITAFIGPTNCAQWDLLSLNVVADGADRLILLPDDLPHLDTNNWTHAAPYYELTLTNANELRLTVQSNLTLSTTWQTYGQ